MSSDAPPPQHKRWTFAAAVVAIIGLFILTTSGLCTGLVGIGMLATIFTNTSSPSNNEWATLLGTLLTLAMVGGIPMLIGFLIARSGFRMRKRD